MWPFELLRRLKYERHYKAALAIFLGANAAEKLSAENRARVEGEVEQNYDKSVKGPKLAEHRWEMLAAERAAAMHRLGIGTGIPDLTWDQLFTPWRSGPTSWVAALGWGSPGNVFVGWDVRPSLLYFDFRPLAQATHDARDFLRRHGITVPEYREPWDHSRVEEQPRAVRRPD